MSALDLDEAPVAAKQPDSDLMAIDDALKGVAATSVGWSNHAFSEGECEEIWGDIQF